MTKDEMRIAIAESFRIKIIRHDEVVPSEEQHLPRALYYNGVLHHIENILNYPEDLNAMHEVEKTLDPLLPEFSDLCSDEWFNYERQLEVICDRDDPRRSPINATATQRAEAYLRVKEVYK